MHMVISRIKGEHRGIAYLSGVMPGCRVLVAPPV